jgi:hypothetical protein
VPTHTTINGRKATCGVALSADRNGSTAYEKRRYQPAARPSGMPTAIAKARPSE